MAAPPSYTIQTDFSTDEANAVAGRSTVRTPQLDTEFTSLQASINALITNLSAIQRDDLAIRDGVVTPASFSSAAIVLLGNAGMVPRGLWVTSTAYAVKDLVENTGNTYLCIVAHTSGTFATDVSAGKWQLLSATSTPSASSVTFSPTGDVGASNAQSAIAELDSEKLAKTANLSDLNNAATARTNLVVPSTGEIQAQTYLYWTTAGTSSAYTLTPSPVLTSYVEGTQLDVEFHTANSVNATINISGLGALTLKKSNSTGGLVNLASSDFPTGWVSRVMLLPATTAWVRDLPGVPKIATQAEMETATSNELMVSPGRLKNSPFAAKAWALIDGTSGANLASAGVTSTARLSTGVYRMTMSTAMSSVNYGAGVSTVSVAGNAITAYVNSLTTTVVTVSRQNSNTGAVADGDVTIFAYGDQ